MSVQAIKVPSFQLDLDHTEQLFRTISALTVDPYKNALYYFFPIAKAFSTSCIQLRETDPAQEGMMPKVKRASILNEIKELTHAAGIKRSIDVYVTLTTLFSNSGGALSFTNPSLFLPLQHLFRTAKNPFPEETAQDCLSSDLWNYSDDEVRFLISRELSQIKRSDALLRIAMKTSLIASLFIFCAVPMASLLGGALLCLSTLFYLISERFFESKIDSNAVSILAKRLNDQQRAQRAAFSALDKMIRQNKERREYSALCRLYITKSGSNLLDLNHPFLSSRIKPFQKAYAT